MSEPVILSSAGSVLVGGSPSIGGASDATGPPDSPTSDAVSVTPGGLSGAASQSPEPTPQPAQTQAPPVQQQHAKSQAKKSFVWRYFTHPTDENTGVPDVKKTVCSICNAVLAFNNSGTTTTMLNHLKSRHGDVARQEEEQKRGRNNGATPVAKEKSSKSSSIDHHQQQQQQQQGNNQASSPASGSVGKQQKTGSSAGGKSTPNSQPQPQQQQQQQQLPTSQPQPPQQFPLPLTVAVKADQLQVPTMKCATQADLAASGNAEVRGGGGGNHRVSGPPAHAIDKSILQQQQQQQQQQLQQLQHQQQQQQQWHAAAAAAAASATPATTAAVQDFSALFLPSHCFPGTFPPLTLQDVLYSNALAQMYHQPMALAKSVYRPAKHPSPTSGFGDEFPNSDASVNNAAAAAAASNSASTTVGSGLSVANGPPDPKRAKQRKAPAPLRKNGSNAPVSAAAAAAPHTATGQPGELTPPASQQRDNSISSEKFLHFLARDLLPTDTLYQPGFTRLMQSLSPRCEPPKREHLLEHLLPQFLAAEQAGVKDDLIGGSPGVRAFSAEVWRNRAGTRLLTLRAFVPQDSAGQPQQQQQPHTLSSPSKCRVLETRPLPNLDLLASTCLEIISAYTESQLPQDFLPIVCNRPTEFFRQLQRANQNGVHDSIDKIIIVPCLHSAMSGAVSAALAESPACQTILAQCRRYRRAGRRQILRANRRLYVARTRKADVNCNDLLDDDAPIVDQTAPADADDEAEAAAAAVDADRDDVDNDDDEDDESSWESALAALQRLVNEASSGKSQPTPTPESAESELLRSAIELAGALTRFRDFLGRLSAAGSSGSLGQALPIARHLPSVLRRPQSETTTTTTTTTTPADPAVEALAEAAGERVLAAYRSPEKVWRLAQLAAFLQPRLPLPAETDRKSAVGQLVEKQLAEEAGHISRRKRNSLVVQQNLEQARKSVEDEARRYEALLQQPASAASNAAQWWTLAADRLPTLSAEARPLLHIPASCLHAQSPLGLAEFAAKRAGLPESELNALLALHQSA